MKRLRRIGLGIALLLIVVAAARFGDGPLGPIQGGRLVGGELVAPAAPS